MAKKKHIDPVSERNGRIIRTEAYAEKVRQLFAATVNEILTLNKTMPDIANGVMYSFDGDTKKVQQKVEMLLRRLHSVATMAIQKGIALEWDEANKACDAMVQSCFGKELMSNPKFKAWTAHNGTARDAFIRRSENGLNLSKRVWRDVRALRDEMEVAITVAVGEGEDAGTISRQVRKYLNDPDLMFRRFQYHEKEPVVDGDGNPVLDKHGKPVMQDKLGKDGKPIVRKKWKKRIADPDKPGHYKWIDYDRDSYTPQGAGANSRGVYKSAAKNAMRVARTETNMAYRAADHERWSAMDFVLGIHIETSNSHAKKMPKGDICDRLEGDYPKDFDFCGWHPQCFCHATPILPSDEEMLAMAEAHDQGKPYKPKGVIRDYPDGFKDWVRENEDKLTDPGLSNPYFVSNNEQDIIKILRGEEIAEPELTIEEAAAIRHANRTPEEVADIQARWDARNAKIEAEKQAAAKLQREHEATSKYGQSILGIMDGIEGVDTSALKAAMSSGNYEAIMAEAAALKAIGKQIKKTAGNVLKTAAEYGEVDASALQSIMDAGKIADMKAATKALAQQILKQKQFEQSISDLIPNAHDWHKTFTATELQAAYNAVSDKLNKWKGKSLAQLKSDLEYEANYCETNKKYSTWPVAKAAYEKKLIEVSTQLEWEKINQSYTDLQTFSTKSLVWKIKLKAIDKAIAAGDKDAANAAIADALLKKAELEAKAKPKPKAPTVKATATPGTKPKIKVGNKSGQTDHVSRTGDFIKDIKAQCGLNDLLDKADDDLGAGIIDDKEWLKIQDEIEQLAKDLYDAVDGFSYQWDYEIRQVQCGNTSFTSRHGHDVNEIIKRAKMLEEFIDKSPKWKGGTTYRGMSLSDLELADMIAQLTAGTASMLGAASFSTAESTARSFAGMHIGETSPQFGDTKTNKVVVVAKKHTKATSIKYLSQFPGENEVLSTSLQRWKLVAQKPKDSGGYVYLDITPSN